VGELGVRRTKKPLKGDHLPNTIVILVKASFEFRCKKVKIL